MKEGAVVLDLSLMQKVEVDPDARTVTVEGGVKIGKMLDALTPHHLAPVTGSKYIYTPTAFKGFAILASDD
jgi:FAD/FMN-containing dehydrogenase